MSAVQPQWSANAGSTSHPAGAAPPPSKPMSATARAAGGATGTNGSVAPATVDGALLSRTPLDIKRWINDAVRHHVRELASDTPTGVDREEAAVGRLLSRMQAHAQQTSSSVEELVSQAVVRLPRTAMELQRMIAEAGELAQQLQAARGVAAPAVEARGQAHVQHLNTLRETQERLRRCSSVLGKALAVDTSTTRITQAIAVLQSEQQQKHKRSSAGGVTDVGSIEPPATSSPASKTNIAELSAAIRSVRRDLQELQAVDPTYGEKHRLALAQHEQVMEQVLEHECLAYLAGHDAARAAELLKPLHTIGRANVVLQGYARAVTGDCVAVIRTSLGADGGADGNGYGPLAVCPPARAAGALKERVIPVIRASLESELNFLLLLSECMGGELSQATTAMPSGTASGSGRGETTGQESAKTASGGAPAGATPSKAGGTPPRTAAPMDAGSNRSQLQQVMTYVVEHIGAAFTAAMSPILDSITLNSELIACYDATLSVKISAAGSMTGTSSTAVGSTAQVMPDTPPHALASPTTTRLGTREVTLLHTSGLAVSALLEVFQREAVVQAFCRRTELAVSTAAGVPVTTRSAVPGVSGGEESLASTRDRTRGLAGEGAQAQPLLAFLQNAHARAALLDTLLESIRDVVHFFPDQTLSPSVRAWADALFALFAPLFVAKRKSGGPGAAGGGAGTGGASSLSSQPQMQPLAQLAKLSLIATCAKPSVAALKKGTDALLTSAEVRGRYPSSSSAALASLAQIIWAPLAAELDAAALEAQQVVKASFLNSIMVTTSGYGRLPAWGTGAHVSAPLAEYQQGHALPSDVVKEFGDALMGIPLALENLEGELGSGEGALASLFAPTLERSKGALASSVVEAVREGVRELLNDTLAVWLDDIVRAAVDSFVEDSVKGVRVDFSSMAAANPEGAAHAVKAAWRQLVADLEYLRNVLSAVGEEQYDGLEECLASIQALPPPTSAGPFVVGTVLKEAGQSTS